MCSRLVGRLLGTQEPVRPGPGGRREIGPLNFFAYKSAESTSLIERYTSDRQFHCGACGGLGLLDDVEFLTTFEEPTHFVDLDDGLPRRRGRPAKPFKSIPRGPSLMRIIDAA